MNRLFIILLLALLAGCAQLRGPAPLAPAQQADAWAQHQAALADFNAWMLRGRIAIRTADDSWSASLHWREQPPDYNLRIVAPLGRGTVELAGNAELVTMQAPDQPEQTAPDAETLLLQNLGWSVPLAGLTYWVRGLPAPDWAVDRLTLDANGRLATLEQAGWGLKVSDYLQSDGLHLPRRLELIHDEFRLRLVAQSWEALPAAASTQARWIVPE
ncbi:MAG: lipoprotein insertase outer membrane protein LolB [Gammaproteobacteria bacterium]